MSAEVVVVVEDQDPGSRVFAKVEVRGRQAAQASTALYDRELAPSGLKVTMFRLLRRIEANPDATITELAELVGLFHDHMARITVENPDIHHRARALGVDRHIREVEEQGYTVAQAARELGIHSGLLQTWRKKYGKSVAISEASESDQAELERLRKENRRLRMERDILKKATAFFANEKN